MSRPITTCMIAKALASEEGYVALREALRVNLLYGHWSTYRGPCPHEPRKCYTSDPTVEQLDALSARLEADLKDAPRAGSDECSQGAQGPSGNRGIVT